MTRDEARATLRRGDDFVAPGDRQAAVREYITYAQWAEREGFVLKVLPRASLHIVAASVACARAVGVAVREIGLELRGDGFELRADRRLTTGRRRRDARKPGELGLGTEEEVAIGTRFAVVRARSSSRSRSRPGHANGLHREGRFLAVQRNLT
jgi:hypothetical protein